ncbi:hypothetical protein RJT34_32726 [Clitoria ternatea]|uniref:Uncharacterized protein n=1 Tax=Clitoria ternatea TaxID=43366 RepID=A0AAN9F0U1_CLITE
MISSWTSCTSFKTGNSLVPSNNKVSTKKINRSSLISPPHTNDIRCTINSDSVVKGCKTIPILSDNSLHILSQAKNHSEPPTYCPKLQDKTMRGLPSPYINDACCLSLTTPNHHPQNQTNHTAPDTPTNLQFNLSTLTII